MIKIRVKVYLSLIEKLGWHEKEVVLDDDATINDLLEKLPELKNILYKYREKTIQPTIMINGRRIEFLGGLQAKLKHNNTVSIFPPAAGG